MLYFVGIAAKGSRSSKLSANEVCNAS